MDLRYCLFQYTPRTTFCFPSANGTASTSRACVARATHARRVIGERTDRISAKLGERGAFPPEFCPIFFFCTPVFVPAFFLCTTSTCMLVEVLLAACLSLFLPS